MESSSSVARLKIVVFAPTATAMEIVAASHEQGLPGERAQGVPQVLREVLDERDAAGVAALFLDAARRTEGAHGGRSRL